MNSVFLALVVVIINSLSLVELISQGKKKKEIHLAGIFPINGEEGWQGGQACEPAAKLALEDVNAKKDLLPGYNLKLHWDDSGCDAGKGAAVMYDLLYNEPQKVILLAGCSTVCTTVAEAAWMWNLVTVCYGASSPALSNRRRFPSLFRTHPPATVHNPTRIKLFQKYGWTKISVLMETEEVFQTTLDDLEKQTKKAGIIIDTRQSFLQDPQAAVANLIRQDARIIVGLFYAKAARRVLCEIFKQGMYGPKYVWFFIGWYEDDWFLREKYLVEEGINCTAHEMALAAEGHFTTEALMWNQDKSKTISGKTVEDFDNQMKRLLLQQTRYSGVDKGMMPEGYLEAPLAYDAIWAIALALNETMLHLSRIGSLKLEDYNYHNKEIGDLILEKFAGVKFIGISGSVAFSEETGDRIAWTKIEQLQNGKYQVAAFYDQRSDNLSWVPLTTNASKHPSTSIVKWLGQKIPQDRTIVRIRLRKLNIWLFLSMTVLGGIGIIVAFSLIAFNYKFSHRRIIRQSHRPCNNIMLLGIILCLLAIIPLGMDGTFVSPFYFSLACNAGTWLLNVGFTLAYGAMFSKIWRVHRLTTKNKSQKKEKSNSVVEPWKYWIAVSPLLCMDLIILAAWQAIDPLQRQVKHFAKEPSPNIQDDVLIQPTLEHCKSVHHNVWLGIIYAYKGLLLTFGLFLAYETRSVKVRQINDSRLVGMSIYNVVILTMITAPVTLVIGDQHNAAFGFVSLVNIFCCFLSMAVIFVPKIVFIYRNSHDPREKEDDEKYVQEQEEKCKIITIENANLQKEIAECDRKLSILRKRMAEKMLEEELKCQRAEEKKAAVAAITNIAKNETNWSSDLIGRSNWNDDEDLSNEVSSMRRNICPLVEDISNHVESFL